MERRKEMRKSLYNFCHENGLEYLLDQWDSQRNGKLTPQRISYGSKKRVWWKCDNGHFWEAIVHTRSTNHSGCPYCTRKRVWPGTGLDATHPELAAQWHPIKNRPLTPDQVLAGSHRSVWWICEKGHEWKAVIKSRASGCGCPICANRTVIPGINDLMTTHPELAVQWHPTKNKACLPTEVVSGSIRRVWWQCEKGHEWRASISSRVHGTGCPVCSGKAVIPGENDLASYSPYIAGQWVREKNLPLTPEQVSAFSNRRVWWRCQLGHEWQASVAARTNAGSGCPYCAGKKVLPGFNDLETLYPQIARQWHPTLNGQLTPDQVTSGSQKKVWWECSEGHVWAAVIYSRTSQQAGCPFCAGRVKTNKLKYYSEIEAEARMCKRTPFCEAGNANG